ncbi:MAG: sulfate reduction electron transfer complex DsrMKJOP subunit DsrM [Planctomycetota bacterium]|jgi:nitrate reductase gamma subunit
MNVLVSLVAVGGLFLLGTASGMGWTFGVVLPYLALALFIVGLIYRVMSWANSAVPFRITTTCGQQKSLPWIKHATLDNPSNRLGVIGRMALEVFLFRSLLKNTKTELRENGMIAYGISLSLWLGAMMFHWSMLIIVMRHFRFLTEPVPGCITILQDIDGFLFQQVVMPALYVSSVLFLAGLAYLLLRRLFSPQLRYISLVGDYFPLFLLLGIGISGIWLRHVSKTDITGIKELAVGLVTFSPVVKATISPLFYGHIFLVCVLLAYLPFSKLVHLAGVFLSPTRNLANTNRAVRHVNPWDYTVKTHTYEEFEDEFREKMKGAGVPVDKE